MSKLCVANLYYQTIRCFSSNLAAGWEGRNMFALGSSPVWSTPDFESKWSRHQTNKIRKYRIGIWKFYFPSSLVCPVTRAAMKARVTQNMPPKFGAKNWQAQVNWSVEDWQWWTGPSLGGGSPTHYCAGNQIVRGFKPQATPWPAFCPGITKPGWISGTFLLKIKHIPHASFSNASNWVKTFSGVKNCIFNPKKNSKLMHNSIYFCISSNLDFRDDLLANQMIRNRIQLCRGASVDLAKETGKTFLIKWKDDSQDRISAKDNWPSYPAQAEFGQKLAPPRPALL